MLHPLLFDVYNIADEMGDTETADKFYEVIVQACEKEGPTESAAEIAEKRKDFRRAIEYYKKAGCLGNAARVAHTTGDTSSVFTSEYHLFDMIIDRFQEWRSGDHVRKAYHTGSETKFTPALDWKGRMIPTAVNEDEMVEADETYWRALFTKARSHYLSKHEYDESKKFKAKLDGDCNVGKANIYKVLNKVLSE